MTDQAPQHTLNETLTRAFYKAGSAGGAVLDKKIKIHVAEEMKRVPIVYPPQLLRPIYIGAQQSQTKESGQQVTQLEKSVLNELGIKQCQGMCRETGKIKTGALHLRQSVSDIVTTHLKSRVMRRKYGSIVPSLIDSAANQSAIAQLFSGIAQALRKWEPRYLLKRIIFGERNKNGFMSLTLEGEYLGKFISVEVVYE